MYCQTHLGCEKQMINILLSGACGKMGNAVARCCKEDENLKIIAGVDRAEMLCDFPIYKSFDDVKVTPDVIIDFSHISVLDSMLDYATCNNVPVIVATTGYSAEQIAKITSDEIISINDNIKNNDTSDILVNDRLIFVVPTYAWRIPRVVREWIFWYAQS